MTFTMCDGSDYVTACFFYLFIELLVAKENNAGELFQLINRHVSVS